LGIEEFLEKGHFVENFQKLSLKKKGELIEEMKTFPRKEMEKIFEKEKPLKEFLGKPLRSVSRYSKKYAKIGERVVAKGEVGLVILAGGMGTRLKWNKPKGMFPISNVCNKSLFQIFLEKVLACQKKYNKKLFVAIMTSKRNYEEILKFFKKNKFFGLKKDQVDLFIQEELPFLNKEGKIFLEKEKIAKGPNGNGSFFKSFKTKKFREKGIKYLNVVQVDNPLFDPFDEVLMGFHKTQKKDISIICIKREKFLKKKGVFYRDKDRIRVLEDMYVKGIKSFKERDFMYLNTGIFCINLKSIKNFDLPLHKVKKDFFGKKIFKFEKLNLDVLKYLKADVICYPKNLCYSSLKNFSGRNSIKEVKRDLLEKDRKIFFEISKISPPKAKIFELSFDFHYPTEELKKKWRKKLFEKPYVEP
jgi:UDP-N-acetylglucosamine/UDP-N-acetylgalactosamine diphosphorylase